MSKPTKIQSLAQFEASLNSAQRSYFLTREARLEDRYQTLLRDVARVTSLASGLAGESTSERLARESGPAR